MLDDFVLGWKIEKQKNNIHYFNIVFDSGEKKLSVDEMYKMMGRWGAMMVKRGLLGVPIETREIKDSEAFETTLRWKKSLQ